jgi:F0F1-type ATP synthase assembly protein I
MSPKSFLFPAIYSALLIIATCITFYGGHTQHMNKVSIIGWLLIIPFCVFAMLYSKKVNYNNTIGGKEAVKEGLKFIIFSSIVLVIFQAIFFELDFKAFKINFIQTYGLELAKAQVKNGNLKITEAQLPNLINQEIAQVTLFKECTSIVFKNLFLGTITSIITAVTLRAKLRG